MVDIYGIKNCDTMKKALRWLDARGVPYRFHDFKKSGIEEHTLRGWEAELGWEVLLNRRGMMWRKLPQAAKEGIDRESAIRVMLEIPSIIKRPVLDTGDGLYVGFSEEKYAALFA